MALSKPILKALSFYLGEIYEHPLRTSAVSCCVVTLAGNLAYQKLANVQPIDYRSAISYGVFGFGFAGISHLSFFRFLEWITSDEASFPIIKKLFFERVLYHPLYQAFALYIIARLEGKSHVVALDELKGLGPKLTINSWKYLTALQLLKVIFVPETLQIFVHYFIGFFWTIYFSHERRKYQQKKKTT